MFFIIAVDAFHIVSMLLQFLFIHLGFCHFSDTYSECAIFQHHRKNVIGVIFDSSEFSTYEIRCNEQIDDQMYFIKQTRYVYIIEHVVLFSLTKTLKNSKNPLKFLYCINMLALAVAQYVYYSADAFHFRLNVLFFLCVCLLVVPDVLLSLQ